MIDYPKTCDAAAAEIRKMIKAGAEAQITTDAMGAMQLAGLVQLALQNTSVPEDSRQFGESLVSILTRGFNGQSACLALIESAATGAPPAAPPASRPALSRGALWRLHEAVDYRTMLDYRNSPDFHAWRRVLAAAINLTTQSEVVSHQVAQLRRELDQSIERVRDSTNLLPEPLRCRMWILAQEPCVAGKEAA